MDLQRTYAGFAINFTKKNLNFNFKIKKIKNNFMKINKNEKNYLFIFNLTSTVLDFSDQTYKSNH